MLPPDALRQFAARLKLTPRVCGPQGFLALRSNIIRI
jgi:hypothetical protein